MFSPLFHRPLRAALIAAFMAMHMGFFLFLEIGIFPLISIIMNLTFLPGWVWDGIERNLARRRSGALRIWYDEDCDFCLKTCRLLKTFLFLTEVPIQAAQRDAQARELLERHGSWVVGDGADHHIKWDAMRCLFAASPVFWPLAKLMAWRPFRRMGDWTYHWIADNRPVLGRMTNVMLPWRDMRIGPRPLSSTLAGIFLIFVTIQNLSTLPVVQIQLPQSFLTVRQLLGLYLNWTMFTPYPELTSPWPIIEGKLRNGQPVDVYRHTVGEPDYSKPAVVAAVYENYRWRKILSNLEDDSYENIPQRLALNYARYLCRVWNTATPPEEQLTTFTVFFKVERTPVPGKAKEAKTRTVWTHDCFD